MKVEGIGFGLLALAFIWGSVLPDPYWFPVSAALIIPGLMLSFMGENHEDRK